MDDTVLVTGATAGIGEELARRLLERGVRVLVHGRSHQRAAAAVKRIGGGEVVVADLASFAQVRALIDQVVGRFGRLHGLVNNAGIGDHTAPPRGARTQDGHEPTWQVNFLSAFLLTMGLQALLVAGRGRADERSTQRLSRPRCPGPPLDPHAEATGPRIVEQIVVQAYAGRGLHDRSGEL